MSPASMSLVVERARSSPFLVQLPQHAGQDPVPFSGSLLGRVAHLIEVESTAEYHRLEDDRLPAPESVVEAQPDGRDSHLSQSVERDPVVVLTIPQPALPEIAPVEHRDRPTAPVVVHWPGTEWVQRGQDRVIDLARRQRQR